MAGNFALHLLPPKELSTVLLCMTHIDRLFYSLCSKKCKDLVINLNLKAFQVLVWFSSDFYMCLVLHDGENLSISTDPENLGVSNLGAQQNLYMECEDQKLTFPRHQNFLSCREWLGHCMELYHIKYIATVTCNWNLFIFEQLRRILEGLQIHVIEITSDVGAELAHGILSLHLQCKKVSISVFNFGRMESLRKAMIQNADNVFYQGCYFHLPIALDEFLLTNALHLAVSQPIITGRDLNRFLKIWIRSPKQRLNTLKAEIVNQPDLNEIQIMRGIYHTAIAQAELEENMRTYGYDLNGFEAMVNGGFNIRSRDGREATVSFIAGNQVSHVQFFVWN